MTVQMTKMTAAEWLRVDPRLALGEVGIETNTGMVKQGNGSASWRDLPYSSGNVTYDPVLDVLTVGGVVVLASDRVTSVTYDGSGRPTTIVGLGSTATYTFDGQGRLATSTEYGQLLTYSYNSDGSLASAL